MHDLDPTLYPPIPFFQGGTGLAALSFCCPVLRGKNPMSRPDALDKNPRTSPTSMDLKSVNKISIAGQMRIRVDFEIVL